MQIRTKATLCMGLRGLMHCSATDQGRIKSNSILGRGFPLASDLLLSSALVTVLNINALEFRRSARLVIDLR